MVCYLFGAKPSFEPMLEYSQLDPWEQTSMNSYSNFKHFHLENAAENVFFENGGHFISPSMC